MIQSMTGFAATTFVLETPDGNKSTITITIKSLNSRYLETHYKLPYPLSHLEHTITKKIKNALYRGSVYCTIYMSNPGVFKGAIEPDLAIIEKYMHALNQIKARCKFTAPISLENLLRLSNIFLEEDKAIDEVSTQKILHVLDELINQVIATRNAEGKSIQTDLQHRIDIMDHEIKAIEKQAHIVMEHQKEKTIKTLQEIGTDHHELADARRALVYTSLDKIDIHEEISRFKAHLSSLTAQLNEKAIEKGKRLDFTLQELAREINTIAAKCSDAAISSHAVNVKVEIEKAREQVQNIV